MPLQISQARRGFGVVDQGAPIELHVALALAITWGHPPELGCKYLLLKTLHVRGVEQMR